MSEKLVSYTGLHVAHDDTGRRVQSIDKYLSEFIGRIAFVDNTLTVLLADHGNTYTEYTHAIMEGRFEQYHPFFFLIIPKVVQKKLSWQILNNLRQNQKKLLTTLDIHNALISIPNGVKENGIFSIIPNNRTCDQLDLRLPNLCVCDGWDAETKNNSMQVGILDFGVGQLNNIIRKSQTHLLENHQIPNCQRLVPTNFFNVRERNQAEYLITSLVFTVKAGEGADHPYDKFQIEIQSLVSPKNPSREMKLLNFDRITKYEPYRQCGDKDFDMRLCICNIKVKPLKKTIAEYVKQELMLYHNLFPADLKISLENKIDYCIYFKSITYPDLDEKDSIFSSSYEVANICSVKLNIALLLLTNNMKTTSDMPITREVLPYSIIYLGSAIRHVPYWPSNIETVSIGVPGEKH